LSSAGVRHRRGVADVGVNDVRMLVLVPLAPMGVAVGGGSDWSQAVARA
jgi:hypothetical protein